MQEKFPPGKGNQILLSFTIICLKTFLLKQWSDVCIELNPLLVNIPILYLLERPENQRFSDVSREV